MKVISNIQRHARSMAIFIGFLTSASLFCGTQKVFEKQQVGEFGSVIGQFRDAVENAIVEKVVIYAKEGDTSDKKIPRAGMLVRYPNALGTVLLSHGFMCEKYDTNMLALIFPGGKLNVFSWDFRAHGEHKDNQVCTFGKDEAYDVIAAANFVKNYAPLKNKPLLVYGFSMGAVAAIEAQAKDSSLFKAMILDCPFDSTENVLKRGLDQLKFSLFGYEFRIPGRTILQKYAFHPYVQALLRGILKTVAHLDSKNITISLCPIHTEEVVKKLKVPTFFILCKNDEKVSVDGIKHVFENTGSAWKTLWVTNGRHHYDSIFYRPQTYIRLVGSFVDNVLSGSIDKAHKKEIIEDPDDSFLEIV